MQPTTQQISELRANFLKKLSEDGGDSLIHSADLKRVKSSDDWLKRFLLHHDLDMNAALKMLWDTCEWRKQFGTNDMSESNVRVEYLQDGSLFSRGKDIDGSTLLIFKCKLHVKGQRDFEDLKRCVVYWFERLEREANGNPITVFFDMEGCGVQNMDIEYTKYLINTLKLYYPYFLNYIIIYEMNWILNAAFRVIKSLLPEKAVTKMKFVNKSSVKQYVPLDQALKCWGGEDDYVFNFVAETRSAPPNSHSPIVANKKVHFADGSPMSDTADTATDKDTDGVLSVSPSTCVTFENNGNELTSTVLLANTDDSICVSYKIKTTSPEKFRVRPSTGCLAPGEKTSITVSLQPGFQLGGLSRDKFLIMSVPVETVDMKPQEITNLWKNTSGKKISQYKLHCSQPQLEMTKNGIAFGANADSDGKQIERLQSKITKLCDNQTKLENTINRLVFFQLITIVFFLIYAIIFYSVMRQNVSEIISLAQCHKEI